MDIIIGNFLKQNLLVENYFKLYIYKTYYLGDYILKLKFPEGLLFTFITEFFHMADIASHVLDPHNAFLIRSSNSSSGWVLHYIEVRSRQITFKS